MAMLKMSFGKASGKAWMNTLICCLLIRQQLRNLLRICLNQISEIIEYLGYDVSPEKIRLAHYLMDLASVAKEDLAGQIKYALKRQRELKRAVPLRRSGKSNIAPLYLCLV